MDTLPSAHTPEDRLAALGLSLPAPAPAAASYVPYVVAGAQLVIAGQIPFLDGARMHFGKLGADCSLEAGRAAAQACALNILAQAKAAVAGDWSKIIRCVRLGGFVNSTPDFTDHSAVINAASDLIVATLGERGKHARAAVGMASLPFGVAVEIEALFEIEG